MQYCISFCTISAKLTVQFEKIHYKVFESDRFVVIILHSSAAISTEYLVVVSPQDGSAKGGCIH